MAKRSGFFNNNNKPFVYQELTNLTSVAFGIDSADSDKVKIQASTSANIDPFSGAQLTIDPAANGPVTVDPNGTGALVLASGNFQLNNTSASGLDGEIQFGGNRFISNFGTNNTFVGQTSGNTTLTGISTVAVGKDAGKALTSGANNTFVGANSGQAATGGTGNTCLGSGSLAAFTTGAAGAGNNIAIGLNTLNSLTTGIHNTAVGGQAAGNMLTGSYNTLIGKATSGSGSGSAYMGAESSNTLISNVGVLAENNTLRIGSSGSGNGQVNRCFVAGINGVNVGSVASVLTNSGDQLGTATITAGAGITVTPGANTITVAGTGSGGFTWVPIAVGPQTLAPFTGYIANGAVAFSLPVLAALGDTYILLANGAANWTLAQNAGQIIGLGTSSTILGVGGSLASTAAGDCVTIVCTVANSNFDVISVIGNITVV